MQRRSVKGRRLPDSSTQRPLTALKPSPHAQACSLRRILKHGCYPPTLLPPAATAEFVDSLDTLLGWVGWVSAGGA